MRDKLKKIWLTDPEDIKKEKIRSLFLLYLIVIGIAEFVALVLFWLFQIEEASPDIADMENIPFHWKAYFLTAFLIPVIVTFVLGFASELRKRYENIEEEKAERIRKIIWPYGFPGKRKIILWFLAASGFMILLLVLGFSEADSGIVYVPPGAMAFASVFMAGICFALGLAIMLMKYRARVRAIKAEYKNAVSRHIGKVGPDKPRP